jgi:hypothetical protein
VEIIGKVLNELSGMFFFFKINLMVKSFRKVSDSSEKNLTKHHKFHLAQKLPKNLF